MSSCSTSTATVKSSAMSINWFYPRKGNPRTAGRRMPPRAVRTKHGKRAFRGNDEHYNICMSMMSVYQRTLYDEKDVQELISRLKLLHIALDDDSGWTEKRAHRYAKRLRLHMGFGTNIDDYSMPRFLRHLAKIRSRLDKEDAAKRKRDARQQQSS